jgi:hypothetical protein
LDILYVVGATNGGCYAISGPISGPATIVWNGLVYGTGGDCNTCPTPTPTPTSTITPTPTMSDTPTPTPTPTVTESPTPTPTPTMTGVMLNNYFATRCGGGAEIEIIDLSLLTGFTGNTFLGSNGLCMYATNNPTTSAATITPLLQFTGDPSSSCFDCLSGGCVNWEVTSNGPGEKISFTPCCGEPNLSPYDLPFGITNICSKTQPVALVGSPTIVNQGICPGC